MSIKENPTLDHRVAIERRSATAFRLALGTTLILVLGAGYLYSRQRSSTEIDPNKTIQGSAPARTDEPLPPKTPLGDAHGTPIPQPPPTP